jgi:integrase/recombinase XerC
MESLISTLNTNANASPALAPSTKDIQSLISEFLRGRAPTTMSTYRINLDHFRKHLKLSTANLAAQFLLSNGQAHANRVALHYRAAMIEFPLTPATINSKLATLRSLCKMARMIGLINWGLTVENVKLIPYRDTRGPTEPGFIRLLEESEKRGDPKGMRDRAIICLLHDIALRRGEVRSLDMADVDLEKREILVTGKGYREKQTMTLPVRTRDALATWIAVRGNEPGPLFISLSHNPSQAGDRISGTSLSRIVKALGKKTRQPNIHPHALRHTAITRAIEIAAERGVDLTKVRQFSRHANLSTLQVYADAHENAQGEIAGWVAG